MVVFKDTVRIKRFTLAIQRMLDVLVELDGRPYLGPDITVTSINDSTHGQGSRHYTNEAMDVRCHDLSRIDKHLFQEQIRAELGDKFTVLLEDEGTPNEHLHLQVKKNGTYP